MLHLPGLTFDHGEDIAALREAVQQFASAEIAPRAAEIDRSDQFPMDLWRKMGDLGVHGMTVSEEYGGANMGYLAHIIAMEEISRARRRICLSGGRDGGRQLGRAGGSCQLRRGDQEGVGRPHADPVFVAALPHDAV